MQSEEYTGPSQALENILQAYGDWLIDRDALSMELHKIARDSKDLEEAKRAALYYHFKCYEAQIWDSGFDFQYDGKNYTVTDEKADGLRLEGKVNKWLIYLAEEQPAD